MPRIPEPRQGLLARELVALARQSVLLARGGTSYREWGPGPQLTVFVHGYFSWPGVFGPMSEHLAERSVAPRQLHMLYLPTGDVATHATRLADAVRALQPDGPVHIIGHSLGGLIARYYRQVLGGRLDRLVCLASPHRGTTVARRWSALPLAREIAPGSELLRRLYETRGELHGTRVCSLVADGDTMVTPVESAELEGHEVVRLHGVGHQSILFDPRAFLHAERTLRMPPRLEDTNDKYRAA